MIFLRRETFKEYLRYYPVTSSILVIMVLLFAAMKGLGAADGQSVPMIDFGGLYSIQGETHEWWRYVTSMFLHFDFSHLLFNGFALYVFAAPLERLLGSLHYAGFFLISGFAGNVASVLFMEAPFITAGASGAIYGVYAAYLYLGIFYKHVLDAGSSQTVKIILIVGLISSVAMPHINFYGHLGGAIGGFLYFALLARHLTRRR